ncbi:zinc finger protein 235-like [Ostrinia furnacalis]|uniref:zinc finger protein 235-like n=1 Tax=Ostrinia furnacalis TaxID=93504 RepID=UPI001039D627|nr:zinc finger protein 235-like [Ostrinia furnacalis]
MNMAMNVKELCRLCAKKDDFTKDLLDVSNRSLLKLTKDLVQISIHENDDLPTQICLNCEEKMVSFQLFVLECYKAQDTLKSLFYDLTDDVPVKLETDVDYQVSIVKSEVKDELLTEDLVICQVNNDADLAKDDDFNDFSHQDDDDDDDDDYMTLASLKEEKSNEIENDGAKRKFPKQEKIKRYKKKVASPEEVEKVLKKSNCKVRDFVKLQCDICDLKLKTWSELRLHFHSAHKLKPSINCVCGFVIKSKSVLYKHVSEHKANDSKSSGSDMDSKYSNLKVYDFVTFSCTVCQRKCSSWYTLKNHSERAHRIAPVVQCICGITLKSKSVLYKHIQDHKNPNMLSCDKCPRITKTIEALNKHKMRHVPKSERKFICNNCNKIFITKDALKSHERSHIPIEDRKIYHCGICELKFTTRSSAASHKRVVHDKIKSYVCDLCGYACGTNGELRQHRAIHSDDKPFVCKTCNKSFKTHSNLKTHEDTHEATSYQCYVCSRVLNSRRTLRKHLLVHEEKCRHVCSYCHKAFKRRQTLKVHLYTHTGDKPLTCKWCDERFAYASTLRSHRLRCHPDKMAAQASANSYAGYAHHSAVPIQPADVTITNYIKNDVAASSVNIAKNEVEAM